MLRPIPFRHLIVIGAVALMIGACGNSGSDTTIASATDTTTPVEETDEYQALDAQLAAVEQERDQLAEQLDPDDELPPILVEWKAASEARDVDRLRALYTEDGVFVTTGDVHALYHGADWALDEVARRAWSPDGAEFLRRTLLHSGELDVFNPVVVGDRAVAFGWRWSDFASGTGTMKLRDGRIAVLDLTVTESPVEPVEIEPVEPG
jgi:hypothetical protein